MEMVGEEDGEERGLMERKTKKIGERKGYERKWRRVMFRGGRSMTSADRKYNRRTYRGSSNSSCKHEGMRRESDGRSWDLQG